MFLQIGIGQFIRLENLVGMILHFFAEVLVKDESKNVITEIISIHFAAQGIG